MCTAVSRRQGGHFFGRTLDYENTYGEEVTILPRRFPFSFRNGTVLEKHYAVIGMAHVAQGVPLYYDAVNEYGLAMAGLNFVGNACYQIPEQGWQNVAQFEVIPWLLCRCRSVKEARRVLSEMRITAEAFSPDLPAAQLHWLLADREEAVTVEVVREGLMVMDNPVGVLTNNPPFAVQMTMLTQYQQLSARDPKNRILPHLELPLWSRGMGAFGLPGDLSSGSRFVRAAFTAGNAEPGRDEEDGVTQLFHILETVSQTRGCCRLRDGTCEYTQYTSCCDADKGIYYYTTYGNRQISAVSLYGEDLETDGLISYPMILGQHIFRQNETDSL